MSSARKRKVLLVASGGGHWVQLQRVAPAFADAERHYVTVRRDYRSQIEPEDHLHWVPDATRWSKIRLLACVIMMLYWILLIRPKTIVSTGAAPGYFAILLGSRLGARTCWLDSIANTEQLSMSGQRARLHADLVLTQWEHLTESSDDAGRCAVEYSGRVM